MTDRNWGRWGTEDERGALNLVTPETVVRAARTVSAGRVYSLALPISSTRTPGVFGRPAPERLSRTGPDDVLAADGGRDAGGPDAGGRDPVGSNEDVLVLSSHAGTHLDALSHVFARSYYNGYGTACFTTRRGASRLAITATGTVATRGLLLDVVALRAGGDGVPMLAPGTVVTAADLQACCDRQGVEPQPGDAVLVRTGWTEAFARDRNTSGYPQAGIGLDAAEWLGDRDVALVGADNSAVEVLPFEGGAYLPVHVELIVGCGVGLLEHLVLSELAADGCHEFLLVVGALPITGATGSPVNPVAIA